MRANLFYWQRVMKGSHSKMLLGQQVSMGVSIDFRLPNQSYSHPINLQCVHQLSLSPRKLRVLPALFTLIAGIIRVSPLLHCRRGMIEPRQIANHSFIISVVAPRDFHGCDLSQPNFEMSTKGIFMQRLGTCLHVALQNQTVFCDFGRVPGHIPGQSLERSACHFHTFYHYSQTYNPLKRLTWLPTILRIKEKRDSLA